MDRSKWNNMPQCADIAPMMRCFFDKETSSKKQHNCICCCMKFSDLQNLHALGRRLRLPLFSGRRNPPSHRFAFFVSPPVSIFFSAFFSFLFFPFFFICFPCFPLLLMSCFSSFRMHVCKRELLHATELQSTTANMRSIDQPLPI